MAKKIPPPPPETKKAKDLDKAKDKPKDKLKDKDKVKEREKLSAKAAPKEKEKIQEAKRPAPPVVSAELKKAKEIPPPPPVIHNLFSAEEVESFRVTLVQEKKKILQKAREALQSGNIQLDKNDMYDEVDLASATIEQNLTFRLLDRDRKLLGEIDHALFKINSGEYGYCEGTGEPIPKRRLELRPWTRHSVKYKEHLEKLKKAGRLSPAEEEEAAAAAADQD